MGHASEQTMEHPCRKHRTHLFTQEKKRHETGKSVFPFDMKRNKQATYGWIGLTIATFGPLISNDLGFVVTRGSLDGSELARGKSARIQLNMVIRLHKLRRVI